MATKRTTLKIESKGGEKVASDLKKIGAVGEQTGAKIEKGTKSASRGLKAVDAAAASTKRSMRNLASTLGPVGSGLSKLGVAGLAAAGGVVAAGGLFALTKRASESANALLDQAKAIGINVEALQEWQFVAEQSGVSADIFSGLMLKLSKRLGDITTIGRGPLVGFLEDFDKGLLDSLRATTDFDQQLGLVVNRLGQLATAAERASFADALFSESGRTVGLVALQGAERIEELRQRLRDLGGVIKEDAAKNAKELTDTIGQLSAALSGNFNNALLELAPTISGFADDLVELVPPFVDWINSFKDLDDRSVGSLAREAANLRAELVQLSEIKVPQFFLKGQIADTEERLVAVNAALAESVQIKAAELLQDKERQRVAAELRIEQERVSEAAKEAAEAEKARAAAEKKFVSERKKALSEIARLQTKAAKAGLDGVDLLAAKRDEELLKQFDRLNQELITSQEFALARVAIEKTFQEEKADIAEKALKASTSELKKGAEEAAKVFTTPFSNAAANIQSSFGDTFTDIYRNGVTNFEDLADSIKDIMARLAGEITALLIFRPAILSSGLGGLGLLGGSAAAGAGGTSAAAGTAGGILAGGGTLGLAGTLGLTGLATLLGTFATGGFGSKTGTAGGIAGGGLGAYGGLLLGSATALGPLGIPIGALIGSLLGSGLGGLLGGGDDKQKFGFGTGAGGLQTPFGGLAVTESQNVDSASIIQGLANIDETLAAVLSPGQIERVRTGLSGTGQFFSVKGFDNEAFDVVKTRLVRIIDAVAENTVASGLLNSIGRDPGNIDDLVTSAQGILELISAFQDEGKELNSAEKALAELNSQFDDLATTAEKLGFSIESVEAKREQAVINLVTDFNDSITDQILAIENPLLLALQTVERSAQERLDNARTLGADLVEVERLNAIERSRVLDQAFNASNSSIESFLQSLSITGAGGLSLGDQTANAESLFTSLLGGARTDPAARAELATLLPTLLDLKREELGSTSSFFEFTSFLSSTLRNLVDQETTVSTLEQIGSAITTGDNAIVTTLENEIGSLKSEFVELKDELSLILNAPR